MTWIWWPLAAAARGAIVGVSEIASRYRDEPMRATVSRYGLAYVAVNSLVAALVYGLLVRYPTQLFPAVAGDSLLSALVAGFGAMVLLRSSSSSSAATTARSIPSAPRS